MPQVKWLFSESAVMRLLIKQMSPNSQYIYRVQKIGQMAFYTEHHCPLQTEETHHVPNYVYRLQNKGWNR